VHKQKQSGFASGKAAFLMGARFSIASVFVEMYNIE
jgi:hypothetical protein